jgi:alpha-tubulin suppressor-like RCC1 family protein
LNDGVTYTQVSAGGYHTVLLRSDGCAVACGWNVRGQCNIPPLDEGVTYTQVSAGYYHTVLLRSDGCAVACGLNSFGCCRIPSLKSWR